MKSDTIVMRLARGAVASSIAGACLVPQGHSADAEAPEVGGTAAVSNEASLPEQTSHEEAGGTVVFTFAQSPKEWTKAMENEFRRLALEEAKGKLMEEQAMRLEELSAWRDRLEHPRPAEEISLQLKRDRLLEKVAEALKDYVEFQEGAGKKRAATR